MLPVGIQANKAGVHDEAGEAAQDNDDDTEGEIFEELSLEILRRRLNNQMGKLRRKEKQLERQGDERVEQQRKTDEEQASLEPIESTITSTKNGIN